jgi:hypothetical protein
MGHHLNIDRKHVGRIDSLCDQAGEGTQGVTMRDDALGCLVWIGIIGCVLISFVETTFSQIDKSSCRDATITTINIDLQDSHQTYTAKTQKEEIEFSSVKAIKIGDVVTVCDYTTPLHIVHLPPSVTLRITK